MKQYVARRNETSDHTMIPMHSMDHQTRKVALNLNQHLRISPTQEKGRAPSRAGNEIR